MPDVKWYSSSTGTTFSVDITPTAADGAAVGTAALPWSDLFLAAGGVINWSAGEITVTHTTGATPYLRLAGGNLRVATAFMPVNSDGAALGSTETMWSDAFFASGAVLNFNNGDVTLTHSADLLTVAGGNLQVPGLGIGGAPTTGRLVVTDGTYTFHVIPGGATAMQVGTISNHDLEFFTNSGSRWRVTNAGHLKPVDTGDNTYDIGASAGRPRDVYLGRNLVAASGYLEIMEQSAPSAGQRSSARLFTVDNGGGKRALQIQFGTGSAVTIATEP